ncbi:sensor histidine kinase [Cryptosporangium aurantiacum]|uniref:histidine kinase n=1 Tax=Cryptosporangium aurantiacum TaxID=134849 RepID=A0A1M7TVG5_9ACTN|nr:histidine kinase [Cryptosporangium aurantiacum]SHN74701.1 Signal transduction histidine kinase [Cryptosporangium aurantiacum]
MRARTIDLLVTAAVAVPVAGQIVSAEPSDVDALGIALNAGTVVPLYWRRRAPFAITVVVLLIGLAASAYAQPGQQLQYGALVATYTVADLAERPWQRWAVLLGECAVIPPGAIWIKDNTLPEFLFTLLLPIAAWMLGTVARLHRERADALADRAAELERQRTADAARAVAEERARIARDLHDVLAHAVSVIVVQAEAGPLVVRSDPDRAERVFDAIASSGRDAMAQLRRSLGVLRTAGDAPALAPQPTVAAIPDLAERVRGTGLRVSVDTVGEPVPLPVDAELAAYRIVQEGLTNTVKHAAATTVTVTLGWQPDGLRVAVRDDGRGGPPGTGGQGLVGIRERATACGGTASAGPVEGGFLVTAWLPRC